MAETNVIKADEKDILDLAQIVPFTADCKTTPERRKLLAVLSLPESVTMTDKEICSHAGVDRKTYWRAVKDPGFNALQTQLARQLNSCNALHYRHKYHKLADKLHPGALERLNEQTGVLDPPQRNINLSATVVNTSLTELKALLKEQQIDDAEVLEVIETIEGEDVSDDNKGNDSSNSRETSVLDDTNSGTCHPTSPNPPNSHPTGQDGSGRAADIDNGETVTTGDTVGAGDCPTSPGSPDQDTKQEGSTTDETEVPGIPQESIGPSLSEKNIETEDSP